MYNYISRPQIYIQILTILCMGPYLANFLFDSAIQEEGFYGRKEIDFYKADLMKSLDLQS